MSSAADALGGEQARVEGERVVRLAPVAVERLHVLAHHARIRALHAVRAFIACDIDSISTETARNCRTSELRDDIVALLLDVLLDARLVLIIRKPARCKIAMRPA